MALEVVGGAFLSALFQEVFRKMASREVMDYMRGKKRTQRLLDKLKSTLRSVNVVLDDAEEKQIINSDVKEWLDELKDAVYDAEELLSDIKTEVLKRKLEADQSGSSISKELQEWCYIGCNEDDGAFPNLSQLGLLICPKLSRMLPLDCFPKLEKLKLFGTNLESLTVSQESHSSSLLFFNYLDIFLCPNFVCFPDGGLRALNLTEIKNCGCEKLRSLPEQMHTLFPSLHFMLIRDCPELESFPQGGLPSQVKSLSIFSCKKLIANRMQWGLRTLTSLRNLKVSFENSEERDMFHEEGLLPTTITSVFISRLSNLDGKGFRHLTSLENLTIVKCPELQRLPEEGLPASLSELILKKCPLLQQWCQSEGEDWPKIAHIPRIEIDGEPI